MSKAAPPILPSKTGNALKFLRVDADENGYEWATDRQFSLLQINFSANPTGTNLMKRGSWTSFTRLGTDTVTSAGGWA